jgi:hypothetical protein
MAAVSRLPTKSIDDWQVAAKTMSDFPVAESPSWRSPLLDYLAEIIDSRPVMPFG